MIWVLCLASAVLGGLIAVLGVIGTLLVAAWIMGLKDRVVTNSVHLRGD